MSTFFLTSNNQNDTSPNLCLRDPENPPYSESPVPGNMMYLSFSNSATYADALASSNQTRQHMELPVATSIIPQGAAMGNSNIVSSRLGDHPYTAWSDGRNSMSFMQPVDGSINGSDDPHMNLRTQLGILNGQSLSLHQSNVSTMQNQGLSLSLSTQMPIPSVQFRPSSSAISFIGSHQSTPANVGLFRDESFQNRNVHDGISAHGLPNLSSSLPNSKYLRAAQELLDEVVNVKEALKQKADRSQSVHASIGTLSCKDTSGGSKTEGTTLNHQESTAGELSPSERQDLQNKVSNLLGMLDEVDRRYKQYYHQMQIIVSCFDEIAGYGAAKPYTALALQTISRHFRSLRDAISGQVRAAKKTLGEPDNSGGKSGGFSRLRYIDQKLRQQRNIQQFGMMQQHAWRPQRGLPESSVSILRAWLFEHFLHPYPKDSEKLMLARQTGLTRSQVSNWFINARVRLWKPMIEDMYKEEFGAEIDSNSSSENPPKLKEDNESSEDRDYSQNPAAGRHQMSQISDSSRPNMMPVMDVTESAAAAAAVFQNGASTQDSYMNLKISEQRSIGQDSYMNLKISEQRSIGQDSSLLQDALAHPDGSNRFLAYQMAELGHYGNGGVSLTLGLQHCDVDLSVPDNQQSLLSLRGDDVYVPAAPIGADAAEYEYANIGDRRQRFGSTHLLHDFVA